MTLVGGGHRQSRADVDGDGWTDMAGYDRGVVRPRLFWDDGEGRSLFLTAGATREARSGGTEPGRVLRAVDAPYREALDTSRQDLGVLWQTLAGRSVVTARAAVARQWHEHRFGETLERDRHDTGFAEIAVRRTVGRHTWVAGAAVEHDAYRPDDVPRFGHAFTTPGLFVQDDVDVRSWLALSMSGRLDRHSAYGWFLSPRVSALLRSGDWSTRLSAGTGFFGPTALTEETEAAGLTRLTLDGPLRAERGPQRLDRPHPHPRPRRLDRHRLRVAHRRPGARRPRDLRAAQPRPSGHEPRHGAARHLPPAAVRPHRQLYLRAVARGGGRRHRRRRPDPAPRPRPRGHGRERGRAHRLRAVLHGAAAARGQPVPRLRRALHPDGGVDRAAGSVLSGSSSTSRTSPTCGSTGGIRSCAPDRAPDGRWTVDAWAPLDGRVINGGARVQF